MSLSSKVFGILLLVCALGYFFSGNHTQFNSEAQASEDFQVIAPSKKSKTVVALNPETQADTSDFQHLVNETLASLPNLEQLQNEKDNDFHHAPIELSKAGALLGEISQELINNPRLITQGIQFFKDCAQREEFLSSVRAVCLRDLQEWSKGRPEENEIVLSDYPADIRRIAANLPY